MLADLPGVVCMVDDILVYGATDEEERQHLDAVFARLADNGVTLNPTKCCFHQTSVTFLGHVIDQDGIRPDPAKITALQEMPPCHDVSSVRRFLGMATHLGKFIPDLSSLSQPLRSLLVKDNEWCWSSPQQKAFDTTKSALSQHPVLAPYSPDRATIVSADASSFGLGATLLQKQPDGSIQSHISHGLSQQPNVDIPRLKRRHLLSHGHVIVSLPFF